jgi:hypothetical protein
MIERRATQRHNVIRDGSIQFAGGAINCTIRNISPIGAALDVPSSLTIPHEITLLMANGRTSQHCYIVWRRSTRVGVTFDRLNEPTIDSLPYSVKSVS